MGASKQLADNFDSLTGWCLADRLAADAVRRVIRETPELQKLGKQCGRGKIYTAEEWSVVREAVKARNLRVHTTR